ncbi:CHC2 zinc finger domain-containing protein [Sphingobium sp. R-7]|uniref:CHC2 zinc finger domain-containing protein n=1 Tax=Sphingobium sp. R-7 TaxID=3375449 RepID=UPI00398B92C8
MTPAPRKGRISDDEMHRLAGEAKDKVNLSDLIIPYTDLKPRSGKRELVGLCPFHSERTPSFEVNDTKGLYHCWGCSEAGDHFQFLIKKNGITFRKAYELLTGGTLPVVSEEERAKRKAEAEADIARRLALAQSIWASTAPLPGTVGERYVRSRGITVDLPDTVRFAMTPRWYNHETGETGRNYPAVVCAMQDRDGNVVGVQCIFLKPGGNGKYQATLRDGKQAKAKLTFGLVVGSAIRLGAPGPHVMICEGPEDGWTLFQELGGQPIMVACGTALLPRINLPECVTSVTLAGDNGEAGGKAVIKARAAYIAQGRDVSSIFPELPFKDWNDQLQRIS